MTATPNLGTANAPAEGNGDGPADSERGTGVREPHTRPQGSLPVEEGPSLPATEKGTTNDQ